MLRRKHYGLVDVEPQALRGLVTCLQPHMQYVRELCFKLSSLDSEVGTLSLMHNTDTISQLVTKIPVFTSNPLLQELSISTPA